ncbi:MULTISPECIES: hypothetical protein [unclassified Streptomyces]|uniref:hypothetical protein n=1 Tax=unclassified Streptomyces TaxID=2593676 RepID=UPI00166037C0|nr:MULTISPECIES: hypothetical protein [unclassified Streptomyces]MBD0708484.1 hypothetical protein [Streptomyces sp. CBMA291]MBD0717196.1 hypothetical protein [Streptomyces sp. CBMA370]
MGWTVLYIAFGVVALWLLGEVLLQYKARLRWRVLAFCGFLGVVLGVLLPSILVIIVGAIAFAVGQTYVTLSFRRGFSTGWAIGGSPGASRRRKAGRPARGGPTLEVTEVSYDAADTPYETGDGTPAPVAAETTAVYEPLPMPDETGQYGVYGGHPQAHTQPHPQAHLQDPAPGHETGTEAPTGYETPAYDPYAPGYDQQQPVYGYDTTGPQQYAAYSDPYIGTSPDAQSYENYYGDPYAPSYTYDTPPGGVWVPQQRDTEQAPQQQTPQPYGQGPHPDDQQYRY